MVFLHVPSTLHGTLSELFLFKTPLIGGFALQSPVAQFRKKSGLAGLVFLDVYSVLIFKDRELLHSQA